MNSIKTLEEFNTAYDPQVLKKIEEAGRTDNTKNEDIVMKRLKFLLEKISRSNYKEQFVSYEEAMHSKKKKANEDEGHLADVFSKLKEKDKKHISQLVSPWFARTTKKFNDPISPLKQQNEKSLSKLKSLTHLSNHSHSASNEKLTEKEIL